MISHIKISVCIAIYNGKRFIREQLDSILHQLKNDDEIVIVDDASKDSTIEIICSYNDPRIKILINERNVGVVKSFEIALENVSGDYIFLADQDDIWEENKVARMLVAFNKNPDCLAVISNAYLIEDEKNKKQEKTFFEIRKSGSGIFKNIYKNSYIGCCMALRKDLLKWILPFPNKLDMHDSWIGLLAELYGKTIFLDECLIYYRIHGGNQRGLISRKNIRQRISDRWTLSWEILKKRLKTRLLL